jgi:hypothetical protein
MSGRSLLALSVALTPAVMAVNMAELFAPSSLQTDRGWQRDTAGALQIIRATSKHG